VTHTNRLAAAEAERTASAAAFREAAALEQLGHCGGAVSRAYYSAYHAARALLYEKGLEPKTHEGLRRLIGLHYVVPGELTAAQGDLLFKLAFMREAADYAPARPASAEEAAEALRLACEFLSAARVRLP
jgi:uncharacterized protein